MAEGRKNWDKCLITIFHLLDTDHSNLVELDEIKAFLEKIDPHIWADSQPYIDKIFHYMRLTGNASGTSFNLGQLITFGELVRPYIPKILDDYVK